MIQKLALGTVQFGMSYGIANREGVPGQEEVNAILKLAAEAGITLLDTAHAYGDAEEKIGQFPGRAFRIVSKFGQVTTASEPLETIRRTLNYLGSDRLYGFLGHNASELIAKPWIWQSLKEIKAAGLTEKIGYSLYTTDQLELLLDLEYIPDLVQLPYSLFDRKFEPWLERLKAHGTEIHIRSVFLQGLYLMDPLGLPEKLRPLSGSLLQLQEICTDYNVPVAAAALNFVLQNPFVDQVVIGVDSREQLMENLRFAGLKPEKEQLYRDIRRIEIPDVHLLNPANW